jgi:hypothetical protein
MEEAISVQWQNNPPPSNTLTLSKWLHISIILQQDDLAPLFDGAGWAGTCVWHAVIAAIQYLVQNSYPPRPICLNLDVGWACQAWCCTPCMDAMCVWRIKNWFFPSCYTMYMPILT